MVKDAGSQTPIQGDHKHGTDGATADQDAWLLGSLKFKQLCGAPALAKLVVELEGLCGEGGNGHMEGA